MVEKFNGYEHPEGYEPYVVDIESYKGLSLNNTNRIASFAERKIKLSNTQANLLQVMMQNAEIIMRHDELVQKVWGKTGLNHMSGNLSNIPEYASLRANVYKLRWKLHRMRLPHLEVVNVQMYGYGLRTVKPGERSTLMSHNK